MQKTWNLKLFVSLSLGLHLLAFLLLSVLFPHVQSIRLPTLHVEISLLSKVREERESLRQVEERNKVRSSELGVGSKKEALFEHVEEKESMIKSEPPVESLDQRKGPPVEKMEVALPGQEEEPVTRPSPVQSEEKIHTSNEPKASPLVIGRSELGNKQEERVIVASLGNPFPPIHSAEEPRVAMKSPSSSESEILFIQPRYLQNPKPSYPREAKKKGYEGEVLLRVEVLNNGQVGEIEVKRSSGHEILDRSAMTAVKQWRFIPARKGETPISVWVNIPIAFQLR